MNSASVRYALYARVSTKDGRQDVETQLTELREFVSRQERATGVPGVSHIVAGEYIDLGSGGRGGLKNRPGLEKALHDAARGRFEVMLVVALDRFTREGIAKSFQYVSKLRLAGVQLRSLREDFTAAPFGDLVFSVFAWMAEYERKQISERVTAAVRRARARGTKLGRPKAKFDTKMVVDLRNTGLSMRQICEKLNVSRSTVHRFLNAAAAEESGNV